MVGFGKSNMKSNARGLPFYSRKYGMTFKSYDAFQKYDSMKKSKWVVEKFGSYKGKMYLPKKYRNRRD